MADKLIYISKDDTQNNPFYWLQLVVENLDAEINNQSNQKSPMLSQRIRKS